MMQELSAVLNMMHQWRRGPVFRLTDGDSLTDVDEPKKGNNKRGKQ
jgi:hypothetical protein